MISKGDDLFGDTGYTKEKLSAEWEMIGIIKKEASRTEPMVKGEKYYIANELPSKKILTAILGGLIGFFVGIIGGGFLGLIIGGTFFGWLELANYPHMPGYELAAYIGIIFGALIATPLGVIIALRITGRAVEKE